MTVGVYDIDFNHGHSFSLSLALMKVYNRLYNEGHQVIMMKPYEKIGRYNKVFYFKESPKLKVPIGISVNDKCSFIGYGFHGKNELNERTKSYSPSFFPYDLYLNKIKNLSLYKKIKNNSLIDWREKDFTGIKKKSNIFFVNDRDFLKEADWQDIFTFHDNIDFLHSLWPQDYDQAIKFLSLYQNKNARIVVPPPFDKNQIIEYCSFNSVFFHCQDVEKEFLFILSSKILSDSPIHFYNSPSNDFEKNLYKWGQSNQRISFKDFLGKDYNEKDYLKFRYRLLLKQNPQKITFEKLRDNYLTFS